MRSAQLSQVSAALTAVIMVAATGGLSSIAHAQWTNSGGNAILTNTGGRVGVGLTPLHPFHLSTSAQYASYFRNTFDGGTAVFGYGAATGGDVKGVWGYSEGNFGTAVLGQAVASTGQAVGVRGLSNADNGFGGFFSGKRFGIYSEVTGTGYAAFLEGTTYVSANLGVGTTNPTSKLHVYGFSAPAELRLESRAGQPYADIVLSTPLGEHFIQSDSTLGNLAISTLNPAQNLILQGSGGKVGIGIIPTKGKLEINGTSGTSSIGGHGFLNNLPTSLPVGHGASASTSVSLHATGDVHAGTFRAFSDERIKNPIARSDARADLDTLMRIEVTDYTFKDTVANGKEAHKKVLAQQLERVYPLAVRRSTDIIPDIYMKAAMKDGWVLLSTDLQPRDRVRLIGAAHESVCEVLEVREGAFRPADAPAGDEVFVYGREVTDFRSVDYEAVAMLNVSATQELARQNMAQQKRIDELEARLRATLEKFEAVLGGEKSIAVK